MFTKFLDFLDKRLKDSSLDFILGAGIVMYLVFKLSDWGMVYANNALAKGADLMGTAAVIAAVAGIPTALLTLVFNVYVKSWRNSDSPN